MQVIIIKRRPWMSGSGGREREGCVRVHEKKLHSVEGVSVKWRLY